MFFLALPLTPSIDSILVSGVENVRQHWACSKCAQNLPRIILCNFEGVSPVVFKHVEWKLKLLAALVGHRVQMSVFVVCCCSPLSPILRAQHPSHLEPQPLNQLSWNFFWWLTMTQWTSLHGCQTNKQTNKQTTTNNQTISQPLNQLSWNFFWWLTMIQWTSLHGCQNKQTNKKTNTKHQTTNNKQHPTNNKQQTTHNKQHTTHINQ